ncbi:MAG: beta-propeller fold lactonase family protein [Planctomycetia bacterium]|nr:beta-propeller fold lactonase family protein [Planctomycetia bacterium]
MEAKRRQRINSTRRRRCQLESLERRRVMAVAFADDFPNAALDGTKWSIIQGPTADTAGLAEPTAPYSLRFDRHPSGSDLITSRLINLQGADSATVSYFHQRTGGGDAPGPGADLVLEYRDAAGNWIEAQRQLGGGPNMTTFELAAFVVPTNGLHSQFQFRFKNVGENVLFDDWFVDDVQVTTGAAEVRGKLYIDGNRDGKRDPEEQPLVGWTVYLDTNGDGRYHASEPHATSASDGSYVIANLTPGPYNVSLVPQSSWIPSAPASLGEGLIYAGSRTDGSIGTDKLGGAWSVTSSIDGLFIYAASSGDDSLTVFRRDPISGDLSAIQTLADGVDGVDGLDSARSVIVSPDGNMVLVASSNDDAVAGFIRNSATGLLTYSGQVRDGLQGVDGLDGVWSVTMSPDGLDLYATGTNDDALAVFHREDANSAFEFVERKKDGDELPQDPPGEGQPPPTPIYLDGLDGPRGVVVSPDGENVYVAGSNEHSIVVFSRNPLDGKLTHVTTYKDGQDDLVGLGGVFTLAMSADGKFLYATSVIDNALTVLNRNDANGELSLVEMHVDGQAGVNGLDFVSAIAISSDGTHLYTAASDDNAIGVFRRDTYTGKLTYAQALVDGQESSDGLIGVRGVVLTPDQRHLYTASSFDHAVSMYRVPPVYRLVARSGVPETNRDFGQFVAAPVWDGGGGNANWSTGANWASQTPPQPGDRLIFAGDVRPTNENDLAAGITYGSVTFAASGFQLNGNRIVVRPLDTLAWLNIAGTNNVVIPWTLGGNVAARIDSGALIFTGQTDTVGYEWTIDTLLGTSATVGGRVVGAGGLRKQGTGKLVLDGTLATLNIYSGTTTLENGIVELRGDGRFGDIAVGTMIGENAELHLLTTAIINEPLILAGLIHGMNGAQLNSIISFDAGARFEATADDTLFTIGGAVINDDNGELQFSAEQQSTVLLLKFTSDYGGPTLFTGHGVMRLGQSNVIPDTSRLTIETDTAWELNGFGDTIGALTGGGGVVLGAARLVVNGGQGLTYSGQISGPGGFSKTGVGIMTLSGIQTYTGATFVEGGELNVLGALAAGSAVTVRTTGIISGNGTVGAVAVEAGGKLAPSPTLATLKTGALTVATGGVVELEIVGGTADRLQVTGTVNLTGGSLAIIATTPATLNQYVLVDNDGGDPIVGTFAGMPEGTVINVGGATAYITYHGGDGNDVALVTSAAVSGLVYDDVNSNHRRDDGEPGLEGWTVYVDANGNGQLDGAEIRAVTGSNGQFTLIGLTPGVHRISEVIKPGWTQSAPDISATSVLRFVQQQRDGVSSVEGLDGAWGVAVSPDGKNVYATSVIDDSLVVFRRNAATGELSYLEKKTDSIDGADGLDGAVGLVVSPDGKHIYVVGVGDNSVTLYSRSDFDGALTFVQKYLDNAQGIDGVAAPLGVAISPDGLHVFVTGNGDSALAVFSRNAADGKLTFFARIKDNDQNNGKPVDALFGAWNVTVSPDNKHVYVTANVDDAVSVFERNATTGELKFLQTVRDGVSTVNGIDGASGILVSPDGLQVYVTGDVDDAVAIFRRDPTTGLLTFLRKLSQADGVPGLDGAASIATNPEGTDVYVASAFSDAIVVFARDRATGDLTFVELQAEGTANVDGLDAARAVVVSPDGRHIYGTGQNDDAVAVFSRDVNYFLTTVAAGGQSTALSFGNYRSNGGSGVPGDTDGDDQVTIADLNNVRNSFGTPGGPGDADGDGDVDIADLNAVRNNFGSGGSPAAPAPIIADALFARVGTQRELPASTITPRRKLRAWRAAWDEALERIDIN